MFRFLSLALVVCGLAASFNRAEAAPRVVASIKPIHSLVSAVMAGIASPGLVVEGAGSPHTYALKPSKAVMLEKADVVFWIGPQLETFLEKAIRTIAPRARTVALIDTPGLHRRKLRDGGGFEAHIDPAGNNSGDQDHGDDRSGAAHDGHGQDALDTHIWLDPQNAKVMVVSIARVLAAVDPSETERPG